MKIVFMLWSDFKFILRNIVRNKSFSIINVLGLVVGISCFILIYIWLDYEMGFDKFHANAENLYRVNNQWPGSDYSPNLPGPTARMLREEYPEIINSSIYCELAKVKLSQENNHFFTSMTFVDTTFLQMFDFELLTGTTETIFSDPFSIVISEKLSRKLFGDNDPIGKTIELFDGYYKLKVSGVLKDIPINSHIQIDCLVVYDIAMESVTTWHNNWPHAYVLLAKGVDYMSLSEKIKGAIIRHLPQNVNTLSLEPFNRIHLYNRNGGGLIMYISIFSAIALLILLIACFNFINLSTAQGIKRFKELGIRKIVGASRKRLVNQLFAETFLVSVIAALISLIVVEFLRPIFSEFLDLELIINYNIEFFLIILAIIFLITILAGIYPSLYFSTVKPISILQKRNTFSLRLKNKKRWIKNLSLRNILVIIQYILSISFIAGSIVFYAQLNYINNKDLGFEKEGIVILPFQRSISSKTDVLKYELESKSTIDLVAFSSPHPVIQRGNNAMLRWDNMNGREEILSFFKTISYDYFNAFDIPIVRGRAFSREFSTDIDKFIINEKLAEELGFENPIGENVSFKMNGNVVKGQIIGVCKNFINHRLHMEQQNLILKLDGRYEHISIKINTTNIAETLSQIESKFQELAPNFVFNYEFLDNELKASYEQELKTSRLVLLAAFLSITLCSLGLYGLVLFTIQNRRKEISIRKVNGASITQLILIIVQEFVVWNFIALIISIPASYFILKRWLEDFAFSIKISPWIYLAAFIVSLIISITTVLYHTIKASRENPVNSLRYE